jgi:hypothetical protein
VLLLKACPKCRGDVVADTDEYDDLNLVCFQCGYALREPERKSLISKVKAARQLAAIRRAG